MHCVEAADEIERLSEENRWLKNMVESVVDDYGVPVSAFGRATSRSMADNNRIAASGPKPGTTNREAPIKGK